jgi:hypothetical protein
MKTLFSDTFLPEPTILAYIAGLFDGEGTVVIRKLGKALCSFQLVAGIAMGDDRGIRLCAKYFGGKVLRYTHKQENASPYYRWHLTGRAAYEFLQSIQSLLQVKGEASRIGIDFFEQYWRAQRQAITPQRIKAGESARQALALLHPMSAKLGRTYK